MNKAKKLLLALGMTVVSGSALVAVVSPAFVSAAPITATSTADDCSQRFLTFPTWFRGLAVIQETEPGSGVYQCGIISPDSTQPNALSSFIWRIALNVVEMALQVVVYLAAGFILFAGFQFLTSAGSPDLAAKSRQTILNAAIGLVISLGAIAATNLISGILIVNP